MTQWRLWLIGCLTCLATPLAAQQVSEAPGAQLRGVDKISGEIFDIVLPAGQSVDLERIRISLASCRYPIGNPAGDAFAALEVTDLNSADVLFSGWMIASTPALSAMDHPRYDIWVMRCTTS
jgi:hypothetical protein